MIRTQYAPSDRNSTRSSTRQRIAFCLACLLVVAALRRGGAQVEPPPTGARPPFMIGLLFDSGVLQPLFHFADGTWTTPWPTEGGVPAQPPRIDLPLSVAQVPSAWWPGLASAPWRVVLPDGVRPLRLTMPTSIHAGCGDLAPAILTDYDGPRRSDDPAMFLRVGPAFAGTAIVRRARTLDVNSPRDAAWREGEGRLWSALRRHGGSPEGLRLQHVSQIPVEGGGLLWSLAAVSSGRVVTLWESAGGAPLERFTDRSTEPDHEMPGVLTPIASISGLGMLVLLVWEQAFDGGQFAIAAVSSEDVRLLAAAGGGVC